MPETALSDASIREIERMAKEAAPNNAKILEVHGRRFSTQPLTQIPGPQAAPETLHFNSLRAIADYAKSDVKSYTGERGGHFLVVDNPESVSLYTGIFGDFSQRVLLARARATVGNFKFDAWYKAELFTISLLSQFAPNEDREQVFRLTGSVVSGATIATDDDGVSQRVTVKQGIERVQVQIGPGRMFQLRPYSTFAEVAQPQRPFILRMQNGNANAVPPEPHSCALVESDGGLWKIEAVQSVKAWLEGELSNVVPVYG